MSYLLITLQKFSFDVRVFFVLTLIYYFRSNLCYIMLFSSTLERNVKVIHSRIVFICIILFSLLIALFWDTMSKQDVLIKFCYFGEFQYLVYTHRCDIMYKCIQENASLCSVIWLGMDLIARYIHCEKSLLNLY